MKVAASMTGQSGLADRAVGGQRGGHDLLHGRDRLSRRAAGWRIAEIFAAGKTLKRSTVSGLTMRVTVTSSSRPRTIRGPKIRDHALARAIKRGLARQLDGLLDPENDSVAPGTLNHAARALGGRSENASC